MVLAVIQARMGSTRLPGKVLRPLGSTTVLGWVVRAAATCDAVDAVIVATSTDPADEPVAAAASGLGARVVRGPEDDVLARFVLAVADDADETTVVRLTADCPLADPALISMAVHAFEGSGLDYLSTTLVRSLPRGFDVEATSAGALRAIELVAEGVERVHVTPHLYLHPDRYDVAGLVFAPSAEDLRVTLDTPEDALVIESIVQELGEGPHPWRSVVALLRGRADLVATNAGVRQKSLEEG
jgi:spore coat polysaccharide biosynthesis protein SpsF